MSVTSGFDDLQTAVDVPADPLKEARRRRRVFVEAFRTADDVDDAWGSGSLARSTYKDPIHDVDVVVIFDHDAHRDWNQPGDSAEEALEHTRGLAKELLGSAGSESVEIRHTLLRNHAVECFLDDPADPDAFTVDITPAVVRLEGGIWIPERESREWVASDPRYLIELVAKRQVKWDEFRRLVRILKRWNADHGETMKSLVIEVLALTHLREASRPNALQTFFAAAAEAVLEPVDDPAGLCGEIQPGMDRYEAKKRLEDAATTAWGAVQAEADGAIDRAMCMWRQVFGDIYPEPKGGCDGVSLVGPAAAAGTTVNIAPRLRRPVRDAPQG
jgi:Second Messenger Oligonucleotide or Dinucleotide Synthetase domain